jgi:hypothetical protein
VGLRFGIQAGLGRRHSSDIAISHHDDTISAVIIRRVVTSRLPNNAMLILPRSNSVDIAPPDSRSPQPTPTI